MLGFNRGKSWDKVLQDVTKQTEPFTRRYRLNRPTSNHLCAIFARGLGGELSKTWGTEDRPIRVECAIRIVGDDNQTVEIEARKSALPATSVEPTQTAMPRRYGPTNGTPYQKAPLTVPESVGSPKELSRAIEAAIRIVTDDNPVRIRIDAEASEMLAGIRRSPDSLNTVLARAKNVVPKDFQERGYSVDLDGEFVVIKTCGMVVS